VDVISFREASIEGADVYHVGLKFPLSGKSGYLFALPRIKSRIAAMDPDLLHAHHLTSYGFLAALTGFHPLIASAWGSDILVSPRRWPFYKVTLRHTLEKADLVTVTSRAMRVEGRKYSRKEVHVVPFGVDTDRFAKRKTGSPERHFTIGSVKALTENSGIRYLIESFALLKRTFPDIRLHLVGAGPEEARLKELVDDLEMTGEVRFWGQVPHEELPERLNQMDLLVMPSLSESFGVAALEAAACELPVIATRVGGLPEVVRDGQTGYLVPPRDPRVLAGKIKELIQRPELARRLGKNGRRMVLNEYVWEKNARKMEMLYRCTVTKRI